MQYIIVLERTALTPPTFRFLLRADVPLARQPYYANAELVSVYADTPPADLAALRAGAVVETVGEMTVGALTVPQIKAELIAAQQAFQAKIDGQAANQWRYYGTSWDGASWTDAGVN